MKLEQIIADIKRQIQHLVEKLEQEKQKNLLIKKSNVSLQRQLEEMSKELEDARIELEKCKKSKTENPKGNNEIV